MKQFLSDEVVGKGKGKETLAVIDSKLGKQKPSHLPKSFTNRYFRTFDHEEVGH